MIVERKLKLLAEHCCLLINIVVLLLNPQSFDWFGSFPSGFVARHSFHCSVTVSCCVYKPYCFTKFTSVINHRL